MDAQLKRGFLEICVLAMLAKGDSYGYRIIADLDVVTIISESTVYSILKRLKRRGCVSAYSIADSGHLRRYYSIETAGRMRIAEFVSEWEKIKKLIEFIGVRYNDIHAIREGHGGAGKEAEEN